MKKLVVTLLSMLACITAQAANPTVELKTNKGAITIELYPEKAPVTVENFLRYVESGFYRGTIFHRVIPGFMIQGGGFTENYNRKQTDRPIRNEASKELRNRIGSVAMARTSDPHSATSQFFINVAENRFLDFRSATAQGYGYAVFGQVVAGMDIVSEIANAPTGRGGPFAKDAPVDMVIIKSAKVIGEAK
jgi:cyclophilin family peptidyl-prolyl cis-trans isomerase